MSWLPDFSHEKTLADIQAAYQPHVVQSPNIQPQRNQFLDALEKTAPQVLAAIRQRQTDQVANAFLQKSGAPDELQGKGDVAWKAYQDYQANQPDTATDDLNYQILDRKAHPENYPEAALKPMTQYQREHMGLMQRREDRLGVGNPDKEVKTDTGRPWSDWNQLAENDLAHIGTDPTDSTRFRGTFTKQVNGADVTSTSTISKDMFEAAKARHAGTVKYPGGSAMQSDVNQAKEAGGLPQSGGDSSLVTVSSVADARGLKPGTKYRTPDGRTFIR